MKSLAAFAAALLLVPSPARAWVGRELWLYYPTNLLVDENVAKLEAIWERAAQAGYTHVFLTDSKFSRLGDLPERYHANVKRVKDIAARLKLEIVPGVFPIGYSNDLLFHDPNLIEALPVRDAPLVVKDGEARLVADDAPLPALGAWDWHDDTVAFDGTAAVITDPKGRNCRLVRKLALRPYRQYHFSVKVRARYFEGTAEAKVLAGNFALNQNSLGVQPTQEWTTHHVVFNSQDKTEANLYLGCWGGGGGRLEFDAPVLEEVAFVNLVRRPGTPLDLRTADGKELVEGRDFEPLRDPKMGHVAYPGTYDIWHAPPVLKTKLPDGTRLLASYYHAVTSLEEQAMICPSEPATLEILRKTAREIHREWGAKRYFMNHDEIRVLNHCAACRNRNLSAGAILADNVRTCLALLREVNPGGEIYVWSDMFDPNHNSRAGYYLVRGDLAGSWEGLDKDVIIVPWAIEFRAKTLPFFAEKGHRQLLAGYYDDDPARLRDWLDAAKPYEGITGVMYTTWRNDYTNLERFAKEAGVTK